MNPNEQTLELSHNKVLKSNNYLKNLLPMHLFIGLPLVINSYLLASTILPYSGGIIAPLEIALIKSADLVFVNFPKPSNVRG